MIKIVYDYMGPAIQKETGLPVYFVATFLDDQTTSRGHKYYSVMVYGNEPTEIVTTLFSQSRIDRAYNRKVDFDYSNLLKTFFDEVFSQKDQYKFFSLTHYLKAAE